MVLALTADQIFSANWSYQPQQLAPLCLPGDAVFPIVRCLDCSFVYASRLPDSGFLGAVYDQVIDAAAAKLYSFGIESMAARMRYVSRLLRLLEGGAAAPSILDFGCGFGPTLALLSVVGSVQAFGFDTSAVRVDELRRNGFQVSRDITETKRMAPYDAVILDNVLEHMANPSEALQIIRSLCRDTAIVFVGVPDANATFLRRQQILLGRGIAASMEINPWEHLNYFDMKHLDALLASQGFLPLAQAELPGEVEIGLRPERQLTSRLKNAAASSLRLARYALTGDRQQSVNAMFYRCTAAAY
jgi:SAM-dependent methyltransferase